MVLRRIIFLILTVYIFISGVLYLFQDNIIFFRQSISNKRLQEIRESFPMVEEITLTTADDIKLHGWLVNRKSEDHSPLLIYFGGNAEEVSWMIEHKNKLSEWSILLINYRGYGLSEGMPGETAMYSDALFLYDEFSKREKIDNNKIAIMGRSLGTAMSVYLSARRRVAGTVLVSPFGSMEDLAKANFPVIPVGPLLKHKLNVKPLASAAGNPMLTLVAGNDQIIPMKHSERLFKAWNGDKKLVVIEHSDHNSISRHSDYWHNIRNFLNSLLTQ